MLRKTYILPVKGQGKEPQALVVGSTTKDVRQSCSFRPCRMHSSQARNGYRVEPGEDVCGEELIREHTRERDPEPSDGLGVLN